MPLSEQDRSKAQIPFWHNNPILLLSLDGVNTDLLYEMIDDGSLPHLKDVFFDRIIAGSRNGLAIHPAITPYCHEAISTGKFSSHQGLRSFNRDRGDYDDYFDTLRPYRIQEITCQEDFTIFDYRGGKTVAINEFANAGARETPKVWYQGPVSTIAQFIRNRFPETVQKNPLSQFFQHKDLSHLGKLETTVQYMFQVDRLAMETAIGYFDNSMRIPSCMLVWQATIDEIGHRFGGKHELVRKALKEIDCNVGRLKEASQRRGVYDSMVWALISDHSNVDVKENLDIHEIMESVGYDLKKGWFDPIYELKATVLGDAMASLYFHSKKVNKRPNVDELMRKLAQLESTDLVVAHARELNRIIFRQGDKKAIVEYKNDGVLRYQFTGDCEVFDCTPAQFSQLHKWHTVDENVAVTHATNRPFIAPSLHRMLEPNHGPDVLLFAKEGYDYSKEPKRSLRDKILNPFVHYNLAASHGYATRKNQEIPVIVAGNPQFLPGHNTAFGTTQYALQIDLVPTLIKLGTKQSEKRDSILSQLDGVSLDNRP